jgi:predicted phage-related endonuclease
MATTYLTAGDVCVELVQWRMFRRDGMSEADTAEVMGLSPSTAADYESAVKALTALKSDATTETSAAPGQARPRAADKHSE